MKFISMKRNIPDNTGLSKRLLVVSKSLLFVAISELSSKKKSKRYTVLGLKWIYGKSVSKR